MNMYTIIMVIIIGFAVVFICTFLYFLCLTYPENAIEREQVEHDQV